MNDEKKHKFLTFLLFKLVTVAALGFMAPDADAYQYFAADTDGGTLTNCEVCHSEITDRGPEHNVHDEAADNDCNSCHMNGLANRDAPPLENCVRCHGRAADGGNDTISPGIGAGLRQHHEAAGAANCFTGGCHTDDAASYTPVGEDVLPTYYDTGANPLGLAPCDGSEEFFPSNSISLDNDGDGLTDTADPDCVVAVCGNGVREGSEECDDGANNGTTTCGCQLDCTYTPSGTDCADGDFCNGDETCDGNGLCQAGTPVDCDDGIGCTDDTCDEVNDTCVNTPNDGNCPDDGVFCNGTEFCDPDNDCSSTGDPCPVGTSCNETNDTCDVIAGCGNGQVDPGEDCDLSVPGTECCEGDCTFTPAGTSCDSDGLFCNGTDTCNGSGTCDPGVPPDCDDGVGCTDDSCNEVNDTCENTPNDANCDDLHFCNGVEICDQINDCQPGIPVDCSDGVGCSDDTCDEVNDTCVNTPNDANCPDDGQFCTGMEFCDPLLDCQSTGNPCASGEICIEPDTCEVSTGPPPVRQNIGFPDSSIADLTEEECRFCHEDPNIVDDPNIPNRHHLLVGTPVPDPTVRPFPDGDTDGNYDCFSCHQLVWDPNQSAFVLETFRDCIFCHNTGSPHHTTAAAQAQLCDTCHGPVNNPFDGHLIPSYQPSMTTPTRSGGNGLPLNSRGNGAGACDYCHDSGLTPEGILADTNQNLHHNTGLFAQSPPVCNWCHDFGLSFEEQIRVCERCHGFELLHNIQADSDATGDVDTDGDGIPDTPNEGNIIPNLENPYWGHIGNNDDCWGCHGFGFASAPGTGPIVPDISGLSAYSIAAGADTSITITGSALTNTDGTIVLDSQVVLTADDGMTTILTTNAISESSMDVTIPGTLASGNYVVRAVKGSNDSNAVNIALIPVVTITDASCSKKRGVLTIDGSGFGTKPEGTDADINVEVIGQTVDIISWSDTQIKASVSSCSRNAAITVNALYGSASNSDSGGEKPPKPCKGKKC